MYISELIIKNFKSIESLTVNFNESFNVIIGQNNCGKTTLIESMQLWKKCYDANITVKSDKFYANPKNIHFEEFSFLRVADDKDIFLNLNNGNKADIEITIVIKEDVEEFRLGFIISKAGHIDNAYFQISYVDRAEFSKFANYADLKGRNLKNIITFTDSRPISSIITKEPYMYMAQIRSKMQKGKGNEVLRNKIIRRDDVKVKVEENLSSILSKKIRFIERDKENREYIKLFVSVDDVESDLLSQGSGFLQIAEIFSSFEFIDSYLHVLLIDEPDAHIHINLQRKLIEQFRLIDSSQLFVITHNEKFIEKADDKEIIFVNDADKRIGLLKPLENGSKRFVIENLVGEYSDIDRLKNANRILFVEGFKDKERIDKLIELFRAINAIHNDDFYIIDLHGIDSVNDKLPAIIDAYYKLIAKNIKWILLRDTDCVPLNKLSRYKNENLNLIPHPNKEVIFQDGYEFESSLFSDDDFICSLLEKHYSISISEIKASYIIVKDEIFNLRLNIVSDVHIKLATNFDRQKDNRSGKVYSSLTLREFLESLDVAKFQHMLCKEIINMTLMKLHTKLEANNPARTLNSVLDSQGIFDLYLCNIVDMTKFVDSHINLVKLILNV